MTEKRFNIEDGYYQGKSRPMIYDDESSDDYYFCGDYDDFKSICEQFNDFDITNKHLKKENKELKEKIEKLQRFEHTGEHIRLSINIETGKLQRHIYATGQWFGDFDRVLCTNWISEEEYQRFIDKVIELYNSEFNKELE